MPKATAMPKFMQTLSDQAYRELQKIAKTRGVTVQELIRAVVLPEWLKEQARSEKKQA